VIVMAGMNLSLTMISLGVVLLSVLVVRLLNKRARVAYERVRQLIGSINAFVAENISGMKIVQLFGAEREKLEEFRELNQRYGQAFLSRVVMMGMLMTSSELINSLAICFLLWMSIPGVFQGKLEIGVLFAFITYAQKLFKPINNLAEQYTTVLSASVSADRIFEVLDTTIGLEDMNQGQPLPEIRGAIEFKNVWFAYDQENWVLKDISFTVNPGEMVAFVGATGSGKTTIMNILARFYEIQRGEILIDGVNIKDVRLNDLRRHVAVVMQDVFLFSGDIQSNIRLNNTEIPVEQVTAAAQYVNAHPFIQALPGGYAEEVKERGCTLSTGQRQLLAFARAITFQPKILVLDEATANIDTQTELMIQDSLDKISKNLTMLVVAHRLSTIQHADKIIVIHKGHIREIGTHAELLAKGGIYSRLYRFQYAQ
jgi:ATP-binding cassette, subfamily B, multidrug efflux pump